MKHEPNTKEIIEGLQKDTWSHTIEEPTENCGSTTNMDELDKLEAPHSGDCVCKEICMPKIMALKQEAKDTCEGWEEEFECLMPKTSGEIMSYPQFCAIRTLFRVTIARAREEGFIDGQKYAFGVDRERVKEEGREEERARFREMAMKMVGDRKEFEENEKLSQWGRDGFNAHRAHCIAVAKEYGVEIN